MAYCQNILPVNEAEFLGNSLYKINTNYFNLSAGICSLEQDLVNLNNFVRSLSGKDSPTIDFSFSSLGYFVSADVKDNSIATSKLGIDIPTTTKTFLKFAKVSNLIDLNLSEVFPLEALRWDGTESKWLNSSLTNNVGATHLYGLLDVKLNNRQNKDILKYNSTLSKWINSPDVAYVGLENKNYGDINVSGVSSSNPAGTLWKILPGTVGSNELATGAINKPPIGQESLHKIATRQVTGPKFTIRTLQRDRFDPEIIWGESNVGFNLGAAGAGNIYKDKSGETLRFKTLRAAGSAHINSLNSSIEIFADEIPDPPIPTADNAISFAGTNSANVYSGFNSTQTERTFKFRTLVAGNGISIDGSTNPNEIIINRTLQLGVSLLCVDSTGAPDTATIPTRLSEIFPPANFGVDTICKVEAIFGNTNLTVNVTVPYSAKYKYDDKSTAPVTVTRCICQPQSMCCSTQTTPGTVNFALSWVEPPSEQETGLKCNRKGENCRTVNVPGFFSFETDLIGTGNFSGGSFAITRDPVILTYKNTGTGWVSA